MNHFDPNKTDQTGRREIASHYYPLTGPYDSSDKDILEYHVLLMKLSGIDGVMVDWYGDENFNDYGVINSATGALFNYIKKANLYFVIVYEDGTIKAMVNAGHINIANAVSYGKKAIDYLQNTWFASDSYLKIDNRPVLLNFGLQYFKSSSDWITIFSDLPVQPLFFTEDNILSAVSVGAYPCPPMWKSNSSGVLTQSALNDYLNQFYQKANGWNHKIGSAFPGFYDIYEEVGVGSSYGFLDSQNGVTFNSTLQQALDNHPDIIQLVTWNDFGEGTNIEPTLEYGYQYLERIQEIKKSAIDSSFNFKKEDLTLPYKIYELRKKFPNDNGINSILDKTFDLIVSGDIEKANYILDSLATPADVQTNSGINPKSYVLNQNYPNPFNPSTVINYYLPVPGYVSLKIYDSIGREIAVLANEFQQSGNHNIQFSFPESRLPSGVYFYRLQSGGFVQTKKMTILK